MIINFDNAATTFPKPAAVKKAALYAMEHYTSSGRGGHPLAAETSRAVYSARAAAAEFFGAEPENTVFTMNCTHSLNIAIQGIMRGGGHMIISGMDMSSAIPVDSGTVITTRIKVFFNACRKYGSCST